MNREEIKYDVMDWIYLTRDWQKWRDALRSVNTGGIPDDLSNYFHYEELCSLET
jgi:hypothetical protein